MTRLLEIEDLRVQFFTSEGIVRAVDGISYNVEPGETVAIVGESGSDKSVSALAMLRLIPDPPGTWPRYWHCASGTHDLVEPGAQHRAACASA